MSTLGQLSRKSELAKAIRHAMKPEHWSALIYYCTGSLKKEWAIALA